MLGDFIRFASYSYSASPYSIDLGAETGTPSLLPPGNGHSQLPESLGTGVKHRMGAQHSFDEDPPDGGSLCYAKRVISSKAGCPRLHRLHPPVCTRLHVCICEGSLLGQSEEENDGGGAARLSFQNGTRSVQDRWRPEGGERGIQGNQSRNGNGYARNCEITPECDKLNTPVLTPFPRRLPPARQPAGRAGVVAEGADAFRAVRRSRSVAAQSAERASLLGTSGREAKSTSRPTTHPTLEMTALPRFADRSQ